MVCIPFRVSSLGFRVSAEGGALYVRKLVTNEKVKAHLTGKFPDFLAKAEGIVFDATDGQQNEGKE
ncbi:MAG: hypothetical protein ABIF71_03220 [Planctomycetota bacterium]